MAQLDDTEYDPDAKPIPVAGNPFVPDPFKSGYDPTDQSGAWGAAPGEFPGKVRTMLDLLERGRLTDPTAGLGTRLGEATLQHLYNTGQNLYRNVMAPGDYMQGLISPEEAQARAVGLAGSLVGPGVGRAVTGEAGAGMFGGILSKTADIPAFKAASQMEAQGIHPRQIWNDTGWYRNAQGNWRYEIPDMRAQLTGKDVPVIPEKSVPGAGGTSVPLGSVLDHPDLYKAYPAFADMPVASGFFENPRKEGSFKPYLQPMWGTPPGAIQLSAARCGTDMGSMLPFLLHEGQHGIQHYEQGIPPGKVTSVPSQFDEPYSGMNQEARRSPLGLTWQDWRDYTQYKDRLQHAGYESDPIEVEARNVEKRQLWTPAERQATPPWMSQPVGTEFQAMPASITESMLLGRARGPYIGPDTPGFTTQAGILRRKHSQAGHGEGGKIPMGRGLGPMGLEPTEGPVPVHHHPFSHEEDGSLPINHILAQPEVAQAIANPQIIRKEPVPYGAGASKSSYATHIDPKIPQYDPRFVGADGQPLLIDKYLNIHEQVEKAAMERGERYETAHVNKATPAEHAAIRADGGDPAVYERILKPYLAQTEKESLKGASPDLYQKPYGHSHSKILETYHGGQGQGGKVWHASPHSFKRFDMSKLGTGTGARTYGEGMYTAEEPGVAKDYQRQFTYEAEGMPHEILDPEGQKYDWEGEHYGGPPDPGERDVQSPAYMAFQHLAEAGNFDEARKALDLSRDYYHEYGSKANLRQESERGARMAKHYRDAAEHLDLIQAQGYRAKEKQRGKMYEVEINANPEHFLHWDHKLSDQSDHVKLALHRSGIAPEGDPEYADMTGADLYKHLDRHEREDRSYTPELLKKAGIPGAKHYDQFSRNTYKRIQTAEKDVGFWKDDVKFRKEYGRSPDFKYLTGRTAAESLQEAEGRLAKLKEQKLTHNYVVFDPHLMQILRRDEQPMALPAVQGGGSRWLATVTR